MQELLSISERRVGLEKFNNDWEEVRSFVRAEGLDGIELVLGNDPDGPQIPCDLIKTVHLPIWLGWTRTWSEPRAVPDDCDSFELAANYGARNPEDLQAAFCSLLSRAAGFRAAYAVVHAGYLELEEFYTRSYRYGSREILASVASFANSISSRYPGGEPPVTLAFENIWFSGLTFQSPEDAQYFTDLLTFDNWIFLLDTGHLMNGLDVKNEQEGIRNIISTLDQLSDETRAKIRAIHFQCSTSGEYQQFHMPFAIPSAFPSMSYREKMDDLMQCIHRIDEHRPFSDPACREIVDMIQPDFLVHELVARSRDDLRNYLRQQKALTRNPAAQGR